MDLTNILKPRYMDLTLSQVQGNINLTSISDPKRLDLVVSQIQGNDHPYLARVRE